MQTKGWHNQFVSARAKKMKFHLNKISNECNETPRKKERPKQNPCAVVHYNQCVHNLFYIRECRSSVRKLQ